MCVCEVLKAARASDRVERARMCDEGGFSAGKPVERRSLQIFENAFRDLNIHFDSYSVTYVDFETH